MGSKIHISRTRDCFEQPLVSGFLSIRKYMEENSCLVISACIYLTPLCISLCECLLCMGQAYGVVGEALVHCTSPFWEGWTKFFFVLVEALVVIRFPLGKIIITFHSYLHRKHMLDQSILHSYRDIRISSWLLFWGPTIWLIGDLDFLNSLGLIRNLYLKQFPCRSMYYLKLV